MLKLYINKDFRMLVDTWLFLTLDLWLFKFEEPQTEIWFDIFSADMFNTNADLNEIDYNYRPIKMMDVVLSVDQKTKQRFTYTAHKQFDYVSIDSHEDIYNFQIEEQYTEVYAVLLKRFDNRNYIAPLTVYADNNYLVDNDHKFDLSHVVQEVNNIESIKDTLSEHKKIILI